MTELEILEQMQLHLHHQTALLNSIYTFVAYFIVLFVGGIITYFILRPLWFFITRG